MIVKCKCGKKATWYNMLSVPIEGRCNECKPKSLLLKVGKYVAVPQAWYEIPEGVEVSRIKLACAKVLAWIAGMYGK